MEKICLKPFCSCPANTCAMEAMVAAGLQVVVVDSNTPLPVRVVPPVIPVNGKLIKGLGLQVLVFNEAEIKPTKVVGYQICDSTGRNIQGVANLDPTDRPAYTVFAPQRMLRIAANFPGYLWQPIFEGQIENVIILNGEEEEQTT